MSLQRTVMGLVVVVGSAALGLVACATGGGAGAGAGGSGGGGASQGGGDAQSVAGSTSGGIITTGPSSTSAATTTGASSSSTGGGNTCDVLAAGSCDDCVESKCCVELLACKDDPGCWSCFTDAGASGCASSAAFIKVANCVVPACGPVIIPPDPLMEGQWGPHIAENPCHFAPADWTCDSAVYDQAYKTPGGPVVCNCECGPFLDPDCAVAATSTCGPAATCTLACGCLPDGSGCQ